MTQLLISVKNIVEARIAVAAEVDYIDLKNPSIGALGALSTSVCGEIVREIDGVAIVSATVGENHATLPALVNDIRDRVEVGVDIVKLAVSHLAYGADFTSEMRKLTKNDAKLVAVFFGDEEIDFGLLERLRQCGFYGAMVDTKAKSKPLPEMQPTEVLVKFIKKCNEVGLISGLAGSLRLQHIKSLRSLESTFIGLRGGVCKDSLRQSELSATKVLEAREML